MAPFQPTNSNAPLCAPILDPGPSPISLMTLRPVELLDAPSSTNADVLPEPMADMVSWWNCRNEIGLEQASTEAGGGRMSC